MKRRFEYRLARLQRVRAIEEQVARAEWSQTEVVAQAEEARRQARSEALTGARATLAENMSRGHAIQPAWMLKAEQALALQTADLQRAHEDALTKRAQADALRRVWHERDQDCRALDELEGRARIRHREELERLENSELDEQALLRRAAATRRRRREEDSSSGTLRAD